MYDVIVVGAGSAGCLLAARLSEVSTRRVLLVERGNQDDDVAIRNPRRWPVIQRLDGPLVRSRACEPMEALGGRTDVHYVTANVLGGGSTINNTFFEIPPAGDFERWAVAAGAAWGPEAMLPMFPRFLAQEGRGGIELSSPKPAPPTRAFLAAPLEEAARRASFRVADAGPFSCNVARGVRCSAVDAFLRPVLGRDNLDVRLQTETTRLAIEGGRVTGIFTRDEDEPIRIARDGLVVLCAGTFGSPQLLLRSGIGPAKELAAAGIEVQFDSPRVGANMQDHAVAFTAYALPQKTRLEEGSAIGEARVFLQAESGSEEVYDAIIAVSADTVQIGRDVEATPPGTGMLVGILSPKSRGRVALDPSHPEGPLMIRPGLLSHPEDVERLLRATMVAREIGEHAFVREQGATEIFPGLDCRTEDDLRRYVLGTGNTFHHAVGTCSMGLDEQSVVAPDLRVRGVQGLAIADASVMPVIPSVPINASVFAVAERAAGIL